MLILKKTLTVIKRKRKTLNKSLRLKTGTFVFCELVGGCGSVMVLKV